jgi:hypothetical protein
MMHDILQNIVPTGILAVITFIAGFIRHLAKSVDDLNKQMGVFMNEMKSQARSLRDHEERIRVVERTTARSDHFFGPQ